MQHSIHYSQNVSTSVPTIIIRDTADSGLLITELARNDAKTDMKEEMLWMVQPAHVSRKAKDNSKQDKTLGVVEPLRCISAVNTLCSPRQLTCSFTDGNKHEFY